MVSSGATANGARTDQRSLADLETALREGLTDEKLDAVAAIASLGAKAWPATGTLISATKDKDLCLQRWAVYSLGEIGPRAHDAVPTIVGLLQHKDPSLRIYSAFALCRIAPAKSLTAMPVLLEALWNVNPEIKSNAADLIGSIGPPAKDAVLHLAVVVEYNSRDGISMWHSTDTVHTVPPRSNDELEWPTQYISKRDVQQGLRYSKSEGMIVRV